MWPFHHECLILPPCHYGISGETYFSTTHLHWAPSLMVLKKAGHQWVHKCRSFIDSLVLSDYQGWFVFFKLPPVVFFSVLSSRFREKWAELLRVVQLSLGTTQVARSESKKECFFKEWFDIWMWTCDEIWLYKRLLDPQNGSKNADWLDIIIWYHQVSGPLDNLEP